MKSVPGRFAALTFLFLVAIVFSRANKATAQSYNYDATVLSNKPAMYLQMQETPGAATAIDSSGNGFNGAIDYDLGFNGTNDYPLLGFPGVYTNAYFFHSYTDSNYETHVSQVDVGYSGTLNPQGPFSVEFWARATSDANNYVIPVGSVSGSYPQPGWRFYQTPGTPGSWAFDLQSANAFLQTAQVVKNQWTHLVGVYDGTNAIFYVNGVATASALATGFVPNTGSGDLFIGNCPPSGWGAFDGYLTHVAFYTNALSPTQILNDYIVGTNCLATNGQSPNVLVDPGATNTNPQSISINAGSTATFDPIAFGSTPLHYQWYTNGVAEGGANNSLLSFTASGANNGTTYYVIVTNNFGSSTSQVATLTVYSALIINSAPMPITRYVGSYAAFHVTASGTSPLNYQWSVSTDGGTTFTPIPGATKDTLWLPNVQIAQNGNKYSVLVTGPGVSSNIPPATLSVQARPINVPLTGYGALVAADKPVAFWQLNELNASGPAVDAVGSFNGTYTFAVTNSVADMSSILFGVTGGVPNDASTAVGLASPTPGIGGIGGTVQIPWAPELNPDIPWSVETWIQPTSLGANGGDYRLVLSSSYNQGTGAGPTSGWYIYQQPSGTFAFVPQPANAFVVAGSITAGSWYHLVVTDDGTNFNFYINGVLATAPFPATPANFVANGNGINPDGSASIGGLGGAMFAIGQRSDAAFNTFQGNVEDTAVYNYALTPQQIQSHYVNGVSLTIRQNGKNVIINWPAGTGTLQTSTNVAGPYTSMGSAVPPYTNAANASLMFYRLIRQ
ncbi:MAG TPA: LamG-like jellyroll fold domain-containing protein [Pseudomonadales bacterium]|nr:LamG-like jellyroll fold domain-containing protein [Pseudomonadales bacterium]